MKHTLRLLSILTTSGALLAGSIGCEQGFEPEEGDEDVGVSAERHRGPPGGRLHEALGLDESQREQASALRAAMERDLEPVEQQLREKQEQLRAAWAVESPDRAAILELGSQIDALHRSMRDRRTELRVAMNGLLTPEQRARRAELGQGRGPRDDRGRPGPRGARVEESEPDEDGEHDERLGPPQGEHARFRQDGAAPRRGRGGRDHGPGGRGGMMAFGPGLAQRLGLEEAQQAQVQALADQMRDAGAPMREQLPELREQERALWAADQLDERAIDQLHDRMDALMSAERERQVDFRLAVIQLLTPDQRTRFAELHADRDPRGNGMGRGRGMGHGRVQGDRRGAERRLD